MTQHPNINVVIDYKLWLQLEHQCRYALHLAGCNSAEFCSAHLTQLRRVQWLQAVDATQTRASACCHADSDAMLLRALTACVLWEITMQDLQPIVDWQEDVADMLVSTNSALLFTLAIHEQMLAGIWVYWYWLCSATFNQVLPSGRACCKSGYRVSSQPGHWSSLPNQSIIGSGI